MATVCSPPAWRSPDSKEILKEMEEDKEDVKLHDGGDLQGGPYVPGRGRGMSAVPGICHRRNAGVTTYVAKVGFDWLSLRGRARRELGQAVDDHVVLVAIKLRVMRGSRGAERCGVAAKREEDKGDLDLRLRRAIEEVLCEHGMTLSELGLSAEVTVPASHWVGRGLASPLYSWRDLDLAFVAWRKLRQARS